MKTVIRSGIKKLSEAVADGTLIDVSHLGNEKGLKCKAFISSSLWEKGLSCSRERLLRILGLFAGTYTFLYDYNHYGPIHLDGCPDLTKNNYEGYCTGILEPNDEFGVVLILLEYRTDKESQLVRSTTSSGEYAN